MATASYMYTTQGVSALWCLCCLPLNKEPPPRRSQWQSDTHVRPSLCRVLYILGEQTHSKAVDVKVINASRLVWDHELQTGRGHQVTTKEG